MSQHDYVINNDSGASVRADINSALQAILSQNSGTSAPSSTAAGTMWLDTTGGAPYTLKIRDAGNNHWLTIGSITDPGSDGNLAVSAIEGTNVLSTGQSGGSKFLREDGDGTCSFQSVSSNYEFLSKATASNSASIEFTSLSNYSTYKNLYFIFDNILPQTENTHLMADIATSGTSYINSGEKYQAVNYEVAWNGSSTHNGVSTPSGNRMMYLTGIGNTNTGSTGTTTCIGVHGFFTLFNPNQTVKFHAALYDAIYSNVNGFSFRIMGVGKYFGSESPLTAIRFIFTSGNITSGSISMYGIRDA